MDDSIAPAGSIAQLTREQLLERIAESPLGPRLLAVSDDGDTLIAALAPAVRLAAAIEAAGLVGRKPLTIHYVGAIIPDMPDGGRWLQFARVLLGTQQPIEINFRVLRDEARQGEYNYTTPWSSVLDNLAPARVRHVVYEDLFTPLPTKTSLAVVESTLALTLECWAALPELAPSAAGIFVQGSVDSVALLFAVAAERHGAKAGVIHLAGLRDTTEIVVRGEEHLERLSCELVHLHAPPTQPLTPNEHEHVQNLRKGCAVGWQVARENRYLWLWPGRQIPAADDHLGVIYIDGLLYIHLSTGLVHMASEEAGSCPPWLIEGHPGLSEPDARPTWKELDWAYDAARALESHHQSLVGANKTYTNTLIDALAELGTSIPPAPPPQTWGLYRWVAANDPIGVAQAVMKGANPDQRGDDRTTPLIEAVRAGRWGVVDELLDLGADPSLRDAHGWSVAEHAALDAPAKRLMPFLVEVMDEVSERPDHIPSALLILVIIAVRRRYDLTFNWDLDDSEALSAAELIAQWKAGGGSPDATLNALLEEEEPDPTDAPEALERIEAHDVRAADSTPETTAPRQTTTPEPPPAPLLPAAAIAPAAPPPSAPTTPRAAPATAIALDTSAAAPTAARLPSVPTRPAPSTMAVVCTVAARLRLTAEHPTPAARLAHAQACVLGWLRDDKRLPVSDDLTGQGQVDVPTASIITDASDGIWTLRFDDLDQSVPGRIWRTEVVLATHADGCLCSLRLVRLSPGLGDRTLDAVSIPRLVGRLATAVGLEDAGLPLRPEFWACSTPEAVATLVALLRNPARSQPVLVVTSPDTGWAGEASDPTSLAARLAGAAHLVHLDNALSYTLTRALGRGLSVFNDAARVYRPGFQVEDEGALHPLLVRHPQVPPRHTISRLVEYVATATATHATDDDVPSFAFARTLIAQARREARLIAPQTPATTNVDDAHWHAMVVELQEKLQQSQAERSAWEQRLAERDAMASARIADLEAVRDGVVEEADRLRRANYSLRTANEQLRQQVAARSDNATEPAQIPIPDTFDELEDWAANYLGEDVILSAKALRAARKSDFATPALAYRALLMLRDHYLPMRLDSTPERVEAFNACCRDLSVEVSGTGRAAEDHRYRESYRVRWKQRNYKLDLHVSGSSSRDTARGFRMYMAYDDAAGAIIIGHLPTHLTSSLTAH